LAFIASLILTFVGFVVFVGGFVIVVNLQDAARWLCQRLGLNTQTSAKLEMVARYIKYAILIVPLGYVAWFVLPTILYLIWLLAIYIVGSFADSFASELIIEHFYDGDEARYRYGWATIPVGVFVLIVVVAVAFGLASIAFAFGLPPYMVNGHIFNPYTRF
jgi:hypothetical protein